MEGLIIALRSHNLPGALPRIRETNVRLLTSITGVHVRRVCLQLRENRSSCIGATATLIVEISFALGLEITVGVSIRNRWLWFVNQHWSYGTYHPCSNSLDVLTRLGTIFASFYNILFLYSSKISGHVPSVPWACCSWLLVDVAKMFNVAS